jgi:FeS assembly SUF system protein
VSEEKKEELTEAQVNAASVGKAIFEEHPLLQPVVDRLKTIFDPEIPIDIYELGLIYDIKFNDEQKCDVRMTLTSPMCPVAGSLPPEVEQKVANVEGVNGAEIDLVWDPPWDKEMMSEEAKVALNIY